MFTLIYCDSDSTILLVSGVKKLKVKLGKANKYPACLPEGFIDHCHIRCMIQIEYE